jgi:hypothetical protein
VTSSRGRALAVLLPLLLELVVVVGGVKAR